MGFRFRKSINLGGGFKVNLSKSGVGYSWGTKGVRFTKTAKGKNRTTLSIPGTGISHVSESGSKKKTEKQNATKLTSNGSEPNPNNNGNGGKGMAWVKFIICLLFGYLGIHKFMEKKLGMGILYLFTVGLFGIGWIVDCIKYLIAAIKSTKAEEPVQEYRNHTETTTEYPPIEIPAKRRFSLKKVLLWVLAVFLVLIAIAFLPHVSGIIALAAAVIVVPIEKWQVIISRFIKGKVKTIVVTVMTFLAVFATPTTETPDIEPPTPVVAIVESTEATEITTEEVTEPDVQLATESVTEAVAETVTESATESITEPTTEPTTESETEFPTELMTEPVIEIVAEPVIEQVTELPAEPAQAMIAYADVEGISFDEEIYRVGIGRTVDVPFVLYPENATKDTLEVTINNTKIATVSLEKKNDGVVETTGLALGTATITLKAGEAIVASKDVTVTEVLPDTIAIVSDTETPLIGSKGKMEVEYNPLDVTTQKVTWKSSAPNVLRVNADGTYQAVSVGKATITATHTTGVVGIIEIDVLPVEVESIALTSNWDAAKPFYRNNTMTLKAEILPQDATDKSIVWTSSDENVVTVSDKGVVKAVSAGTAMITATAANGQQSKYEITVELSPQKFRISTSIKIKDNDHVGNKWTTGFEFNGEKINNGSIVSILPGETFSAYGWAQDNDSNPDYGQYGDELPLTAEMCNTGFTIEGEANVRENGGRYSGHYATWYVKMTFTPVN